MAPSFENKYVYGSNALLTNNFADTTSCLPYLRNIFGAFVPCLFGAM